MDPISALSLFANIAQTVEVAIKTGQTLVDLYKSSSGFTKETQPLLTATSTLKDSIAALQDANGQLVAPSSSAVSHSSGWTHALKVAAGCNNSIQKIEALLDKCKVKKKGSVLAAASAMVQSSRHMSKIAQLQKEMEASSEGLKMAISVATCAEVASVKQLLTRSGHQQAQTTKDLDTMGKQVQSSLDMTTLLVEITQCLKVSEEALKSMNQDAIRRALRPASADSRFEEISEAESKTFSWIFEAILPSHDEPDESKPTANFPNWLRHGSGVFHIAGKPGSGKSTLFKFLTQHESTKALLDEWAKGAGKSLIVSKFFFWKMGLVEQRTLKGMVRGLLYDVLRSSPALAERLFPALWEPRRYLSPHSHAQSIEINERDVSAAFQRLLNDAQILEKFRICIFLDGLDEFEERDRSHWDLAKTLVNWTKAGSDGQCVKLCVSSREIPSMLGTFPENQRIALQDLTRSDIQALVDKRLGENEYFRALEARSPDGAKILKSQIVDQSAGVFLWVVLVLKLLVEELSSRYSSLDALRNIVQSSVGELDDFFSMIFDSIPKHQRLGAYMVFAILLRYYSGMHLMEDASGSTSLYPDYLRSQQEFLILELTDPAEMSFNFVPLIGLSYIFRGLEAGRLPDASTNFVAFWQLPFYGSRPYEPPTEEEYRARIQIASSNLMSWCRGLVDIKQEEFGLEFPANSKTASPVPTAVFTHRSIPEFLIGKLRNQPGQFGLSDELVTEAILAMSIAWTNASPTASLPIGLPLTHRRIFLELLFVMRSRPVTSTRLLEALGHLDTTLQNVQESKGADKSKIDLFAMREQWAPLKLVIPSLVPTRGKLTHLTTMAAFSGLHGYLTWRLNDVEFKADRPRLAGAFYAALAGLLQGALGGEDHQTARLLADRVGVMRAILNTGSLPSSLLDHDYDIDDHGEWYTISIASWLRSFDESSGADHRVFAKSFPSATDTVQRRYGGAMSPWRQFLILFCIVVQHSKKGQVDAPLWELLEGWLATGAPAPVVTYHGAFLRDEVYDYDLEVEARGINPSSKLPDAEAGLADGSPRRARVFDWLWTGFRFGYAEDRQVTYCRVDYLIAIFPKAFLNYGYLCDSFSCLGEQPVRSTSLESLIRYHQPPNAQRLLELIEPQTRLFLSSEERCEIWDMQKIIEETPPDYLYRKEYREVFLDI
ncbi:hypothetical protein B0T19DRAFT_424926 [Cercophora scortea]|uniref:Nephrocystin 3-like N-terminal domain-containing protein n=1 Tax=Cercophora scortea TaxID=314031 RepID=A0AAE0MDT9_9PEZI|nr:hypothetical protein B0T19DRAFT_424926 [Cercophora scortea]